MIVWILLAIAQIPSMECDGGVCMVSSPWFDPPAVATPVLPEAELIRTRTSTTIELITMPKQTLGRMLARSQDALDECAEKLTATHEENARMASELDSRPVLRETPGWVPYAITGAAIAGALLGGWAMFEIVEAVR